MAELVTVLRSFRGLAATSMWAAAREAVVAVAAAAWPSERLAARALHGIADAPWLAPVEVRGGRVRARRACVACHGRQVRAVGGLHVRVMASHSGTC